MVFSSNIFLFLFFPLVLAFYYAPFLAISKKLIYKNYLLLAASLVFYAWGELCYLWLLTVSIIANYFFGIYLARNKKLILSVAIFFNLALLAYFKYAYFIIEIIAKFFPHINNIITQSLLPQRLPIGISFFTFHAISYLVDIYRGKCRAQKNLSDLALYIAFFPQLIAGPIVRYNMIEKYLSKRFHSTAAVSYGIRRFIIGLAKKVIIANSLGEVADAIFSSHIDAINPYLAWVGIICYSLQIYFDFSGYSDMALGLARIFGFRFPENFNYPYISKSIKEFWRRWHMSLSAWFRDYLYIPLGGNKCSLKKQYFNLILVFFLCGLWHGASMNFVFWGLFHGFFLVFERLKIARIFFEKTPDFIQHFYTIFIVMIGWVFFRSPDLAYAFDYINLMFSQKEQIVISSKIANLINSHYNIAVLMLAILGFSPVIKNYSIKIIRKNKFTLWFFDFFLILIFIFVIIRLSASTYNPFIYFQF